MKTVRKKLTFLSIRKKWGINPCEKVQSPKKGKYSKYDRNQWKKEMK